MVMFVDKDTEVGQRCLVGLSKKIIFKLCIKHQRKNIIKQSSSKLDCMDFKYLFFSSKK